MLHSTTDFALKYLTVTAYSEDRGFILAHFFKTEAYFGKKTGLNH